MSSCAATAGSYDELRTVYEAKQGDDWYQLYPAMKNEVKVLKENETCDLVRPPTDRNHIPVKWLCELQLGPSGHVGKYKVRYMSENVQ